MKRQGFLFLLLTAAAFGAVGSVRAASATTNFYFIASHSCTNSQVYGGKVLVDYELANRDESHSHGWYAASAEIKGTGMSGVSIDVRSSWRADQPLDAAGKPVTRKFLGWFSHTSGWRMNEQPTVESASEKISDGLEMTVADLTEKAGHWAVAGNPAVIVAKYVSLWDVNAIVDPAEAGTVSGTNRVEQGESLTLTAASANAGYSFAEWRLGGSVVGRSPALDLSDISADATYTAVFTGNVYTVTLDPNGGEGGPSRIAATFGCDLPRLATQPERYGYAFDGYYDQRDGTGTRYYNADGSSAHAWDKETPTSLFAAWRALDAELRVVFTEHVTAIWHRVGESSTWIKSTESTTYSYPTGTKYEAYAETEEGWRADYPQTSTMKGTVVYQAVEFRPVASEEIVCYRVVFQDPSGTFGDLTYPAVRKGTVASPPSNWSRRGYTLSWDPEIGPLMSNTTYNAVWTPQLYTVAFEANGGSGTMTNVFFLRDTPSTLPSNRYVRTGYRFDCWTTNGVPAFEDGATNLVNLAAVGETLALTAAWTANRYTVVFAPNPPAGATVRGTMDPQEFAYDEPQALTDNAFDCGELWAFNGWSNTVSGALYADGEPVSNLTSVADGEVRLNARWKSNAGELSRAMMGDGANLKWVDAGNGWVPGTNRAGDTCAAHVGDGTSQAAMSANVGSAGTLVFTLDLYNEDEELRISVVGSLVTKKTVGQGQTVTVSVPEDAQTITIASNNPQGHYDPELLRCEAYISNMTWTPAGSGGEPTPGAMVKPSAAGVKDGVFSLTIPTASGTDYGVWTNANLLIDSWGLMGEGDEKVKKGDGNPLIFEWTIIPEMPQLFFRAHEVK